MTVKELIEKLEQFSPEIEVRIDEDCGYSQRRVDDVKEVQSDYDNESFNVVLLG